MSFSEIVNLQRRYFNTGATKKLETRKALLNTLKRCVRENAKIFCDAVYKDLRRNEEITTQMEMDSVIREVDYMLEHLGEWTAPQRVEHSDVLNDKDIPMVIREPVGVVLNIGPWNYPVMLTFQPLAAALAAGNTVILKPSEMAANTADLLEAVIPKYFDKKVVALVQGGIPETTELLKERFDHIMYTGAPPVAKIVMAAAAKHLTPVTLELGGKCPVVVADDADLQLTARKLVPRKWVNAGQSCIAPDYILVSSKVKTQLVKELKKAIEENYTENSQKSPNFSRLINQRHFDRIKRVLDQSKGQILYRGGELDREDVFIPPIVIDIEKDDCFMEDEIFGPVLPVITSENIRDSIEFVNKGEKPLAAYIFTKDKKIAVNFYNDTSSGACVANDVMSHVEVLTLPFGGVGNSGMGRYRGKFGFDTFTHEKAVLLRQL